MDGYIALLILMAVVTGFLVALILLGIFAGPRSRTVTKQAPFECGSLPVGDAYQRFNVRFYLVAMLFILFDVEIIFLYPWALIYKELGWAGFVEMGAFVVVVLAGLIYVWKKGVLDWNTLSVGGSKDNKV